MWEYIEIGYNRLRIHSSIGYKTPVQFQSMYFKKANKKAS
ncbi:IS3 family transposase [Sulfoacidibacillus thermotolerans]